MTLVQRVGAAKRQHNETEVEPNHWVFVRCHNFRITISNPDSSELIVDLTKFTTLSHPSVVSHNLSKHTVY